MKNLLSILSVEALDTRLEPDEKKKRDIQANAGPKRWTTMEFFIYAIIFAVAVPLMFKAAMDASSPENPNYAKYSHLLQPGWMWGRMVDNSDQQYSGFRNNLPYLMAVVVAHVFLRRLTNKLGMARLDFDIVFSMFYLSVLFGLGVFKIVAILGINYSISRMTSQYRYVATWVFGIGILFANELTEGYRFDLVHPSLAFLDNYTGMMQRWDVTFNITMLRMISFNIDYFKARENGISREKPPGTVMTERERIEVYHPLPQYNFRAYLAYCTYAPLYMAGPILTFNDFVYQSQKPLPSVNYRRTTIYAVRFVFCLLTMEFILHNMYVVAISQTRAWENDTPFQISMIALFNLCVIWLKLLLIWRFFRLWSLVDLIDPPENMIRCVANNYSALSFWRSWHRSYNKWVVRYIYVPLGGSSRPILNNLVVFTFVAVWHDIQLYLLLWGWLVVLFILPEVAATAAFKPLRNRPIYRHLCAVGAVVNIWTMMIANLIGFCVHLDGMQQMLHDMFATADGLKYVFVSTCCLFVGSQAMFEFREREKRKGINLRC